MRTYALILLILLCSLSLAGREVISVKSTELSPTSNRIDVALSEGVNITVRALGDQRGVRITIPNVDYFNAAPQYLRTSMFIDRITTKLEGTTAYIDVMTMDKVRHTMFNGPKNISITLSSFSDQEQEPEPVIAEADATDNDSIVNNPSGKPVEQPESRDSAQPTELESKGDSPDSLATLLNSGEDISPDVAEEMRARTPMWLLIMLGAATLLLVAMVIWKYFRKRNSTPGVEEPVRKLEGTTLLFDAETRERMVQKLSEQGWSSREIARELKISLREVEAILPGKTE